MEPDVPGMVSLISRRYFVLGRTLVKGVRKVECATTVQVRGAR